MFHTAAAFPSAGKERVGGKLRLWGVGGRENNVLIQIWGQSGLQQQPFYGSLAGLSTSNSVLCGVPQNICSALLPLSRSLMQILDSTECRWARTELHVINTARG